MRDNGDEYVPCTSTSLVGPLLYVVHLTIPGTGGVAVALIFQVEAWRGQVQSAAPPAGAAETILAARFLPVEEAIQRLEGGLRFASEPAIQSLRGIAPPGTVWACRGDPFTNAGQDHLIECTLCGIADYPPR